MSGTSTSKFTAAATVPNQESWGHYQRFNFADTFPHIKLQAYSQFVPTAGNTSTINIETRNSRYAGFRFQQLSQSTDLNQFGDFYFQSFVSDGDGTNIFGFVADALKFYYPLSMEGYKITNLATPTNASDAANKSYVDGLGVGTVTLTGNVTGSGTVGTPFATTIVSTLNNIPVATGAVNINSQNITSVGNLGIGVASPNNGIEFAGITGDCKICLWRGGGITNDFQVFGFGIAANTLKYTVNSSSSSHVFYCGASSTTSTELFKIAGAGYVNVSGNLGIGVSVPTISLQFPNAVSDCKICLYQTAANSFQVYGFGVTAGTLKYTVDASTSNHVFYCGASSTTSTELFKIAGTGYATVSAGSGTFYSRVPSATWFKTGYTGVTVAAANTWIKAVSSSSLTPPNRQFTTSVNRITFTGSDLADNCVGMYSATAVLSPSSGTPKLGLAVYLNGTNILGCQAYISPTAAGGLYTLTISNTMIDLDPGDYLEVWVLSSTATNITVSEMSLSFIAC
jgi:ribosomal protein L31